MVNGLATDILTFDYLNWRGVRSRRTVQMRSIDFLPKGFAVIQNNAVVFQYAPGWFLQAYDPTRGEERTFSLLPDRMTVVDGEISIPVRSVP